MHGINSYHSHVISSGREIDAARPAPLANVLLPLTGDGFLFTLSKYLINVEITLTLFQLKSHLSLSLFPNAFSMSVQGRKVMDEADLLKTHTTAVA